MIDREHRQREENRRLIGQFSRNAVVVVGSKGLYLVTRFFLPPLVLHHVTLEEYGLWATTFILVAWLGVGAMGVSNVYLRYVSEYRARGEREKIDRLLTTGISLMSAAGAVVLTLAWLTLPALIRRVGVTEGLREEAFTLMFGAIAMLMLDLSLGSFAYVLMGLRQVGVQTAIWVASFLLETVLIVLLLRRGFGIQSLLWAYVARYLMATACLTVAGFRLLPGLSLHPRNLDRVSLRLFFGYGAIVQASSLLGMVLYSLEKLIAGLLLGVRATALIDIGGKLPVMASQLPSTINGLFLPALAHQQARGEFDEMRRLCLSGMRYLNMLNGLLLGFLAPFAGPVLSLWLGADPRLTTAAGIMALLCLPYQMHELTGPASAIHRSQSRPAREMIYPLLQLVLVAILLPIAFHLLGRTVIAICASVGLAMATSAMLYLLYTNRLLGIGLSTFLRDVIVPGILPYPIAFAASLSMRGYGWPATRPRLLLVVATAATLYLAVTLVVGLRWIAKPAERASLLARLLPRASVSPATTPHGPSPGERPVTHEGVVS